jgi:hypothetical protein
VLVSIVAASDLRGLDLDTNLVGILGHRSDESGVTANDLTRAFYTEGF